MQPDTERTCRVCQETKLNIDFTGRDTVCKLCERQHYRCRQDGHRQAVKRRCYDRKRGHYLIYQAKNRAKTSGSPFDLDDHRQEMEGRLQKGVCELTGIPFDLSGGRSYNSPSLDRIEPDKGYVIGNVRWVLDIMNRALGEYGEDRLREVMSVWLDKGPRI